MKTEKKEPLTRNEFSKNVTDTGIDWISGNTRRVAEQQHNRTFTIAKFSQLTHS